MHIIRGLRNCLARLGWLVVLLALFFLFTGPIKVLAEPYVTADAAIVIDGETGKVLYGKNIHQRRAPASTTKILTTILGIELGNLEDIVKASRNAAYTGGSSMYLKVGEELTLEEILFGVMLSSGNDASVAVAEHLAGNVEKFAELMNHKAKEIGALNSTFQNPHGLPNDKHLTTAYDLAMIMRYGMQNDMFRKLTATKYQSVKGPDESWQIRSLRNHNKLLWKMTDCDGGKTGYTRAAGRCLISTATRKGRRVIAVVLHADLLWQDSIKLLDYGLDNFKNVTLYDEGQEIESLNIPESKEKELSLITPREFVMTFPNNAEPKVERKIRLAEEIYLPIPKGQKLGVMEVIVDGENVGQLDLVAGSDVTEMSFVQKFWRWFSSILKTFT